MAEQRKCKKLVAVLVEHQESFGIMSDKNCQWAIQNPKDAVALFVNAVENRAISAVAEAKKLLQFLFSFSAKAIEKFVAKEKFVEGKTIDGVSIAWLGENFKKNFLGKTEKSVETAELKVHALLEDARDLPKDDEPGIIPELAGKHEINLAHFHQLLAHKQQRKDFSWVVGYILDGNDVLWAVLARWDAGSDGWNVEAHSIEDPDRWNAGDQVVSR